MGIQLVTIQLQLDEDAIKRDGSLDQWWSILKLDTTAKPPAWERVYQELASILVGAPIYVSFSHTAFQDMERFGRYLLTKECAVASSLPPAQSNGEKRAKELAKPAPAKRVSSAPPPPPSSKTTAKA